jgi:uncharacterized protein YigE (DUF2233 family)
MIIAARLIAAAVCFLGLSPVAEAAACRADSFEGTRYTVCAVDLATAEIRTFWRDSGGIPYNMFPKLADDLERRGLDLVFAMNAGMFADDYSPIGLYIEDGKELTPANTAEVKARPVPNFYKKPNGIFYVSREGAAVMETGRFLAKRPAADFATQSGPLLVIDGDIHPAFIVGSDDRKRRNGVGVCSPTEVYFAISDDVVNFHDFARYFRDHLGCMNALFFDGGSAPGLYAPELRRSDWPGHGGYGPIVGVVRPIE